MEVAKQIDEFFTRTGQRVFIEVEAKQSRIEKFINEYNSKYSRNLSMLDDGIIALEDDANKWGLELRCYFYDRTEFPGGVEVKENKVYRPEYSFRFNDVSVIEQLFSLGYKIGIN